MQIKEVALFQAARRQQFYVNGGNSNLRYAGAARRNRKQYEI